MGTDRSDDLLMIDLKPIAPYLREHIAAQLTEAVDALENGILKGSIRNVEFVKAKESVNRAVDQAYDSLDVSYDWDHGEPLVMGAWNVPSALKYALRKGQAARVDLLTSMMPLHELLQAAKPLIIKREIKLETAAPVMPANHMTCQVCGRAIGAATGVIALHGYRRPGDGSQTRSCSGANAAPYEVSRERLRKLIEFLEASASELQAEIHDAEAGLKPITLRVPDPSLPRSRYGGRATKLITLSRESAAGILADVDWDGGTPIATFDAAMSIWLSRRTSALDDINYEASLLRRRFEEWRKTHEWGANKDGWVLIGDAAAVDKAPQ